MGQTNSKGSVLVELSIALPNGETDTQMFRYTFDEKKRLTPRDLERHAIDVWCTGYEFAALVSDTEVLDSSHLPHAFTVADARTLLANGQRYRTFAKAVRWASDDTEETESASDNEELRPQPSFKKAVSYLTCHCLLPSLLWKGLGGSWSLKHCAQHWSPLESTSAPVDCTPH